MLHQVMPGTPRAFEPDGILKVTPEVLLSGLPFALRDGVQDALRIFCGSRGGAAEAISYPVSASMR